MKFGRELRRVRLDAGLQQQATNARVGVSIREQSRWENGDDAPEDSSVLELYAKLPKPPLSPSQREDLLRLWKACRQALTRGPRSNLNPKKLRRLIGREQDSAVIRELLQQNGVQLVTLTGLGGMGKSHLALDLAWHLLRESVFPGGVFVVSLDNVEHPRLVLFAIAAALGIVETPWGSMEWSPENIDEPRDLPTQEIERRLATFIGDQRFLLVLDTFDRVLSAAPAIAKLLDDCPTLSVVVTSRAPLQTKGEHVHQVLPLPLPEAMELFRQEARKARSTFEFTPETRDIVETICKTVQGYPLAIVLLAARVRSVPLDALRVQAQNILDAFPPAPHGLPERQATVLAALNWGYDLLEPQQQLLLQAIAVFRGGFTISAVQSMGLMPASATNRVLEGLADANLITVVSPTRYAIPLDPVRQDAWKRQEQSGNAEAIAQWHAQYFCDLAVTAEPQLTRDPQVIHNVDEEYDNLIAGLSWTLRHAQEGQAELAARFGAALGRFWELRGRWTEGRWWLGQILAVGSELRSLAYGHALNVAGNLALRLGYVAEAEQHFSEASKLFATLGDRLGVAASIHDRGSVAMSRGDYRHARALYEEGLKLLEETGNVEGLTYAHLNLGLAARQEGDFEQARRQLKQSLDLARTEGDVLLQANVLETRGGLCLQEGELDEAERDYRESLTLHQSLQHRAGMAKARHGLALVAVGRGDIPTARHELEELQSFYSQMEDKTSLSQVLFNLATLSVAADDYPRAKDELRQSALLSRDVGDTRAMANVALSLAYVAATMRDFDGAVMLWSAVDAAWPEGGLQWSEMAANAVAAARREMGEARWASAREQGKAMPLAKAIEELWLR